MKKFPPLRILDVQLPAMPAQLQTRLGGARGRLDHSPQVMAAIDLMSNWQDGAAGQKMAQESAGPCQK